MLSWPYVQKNFPWNVIFIVGGGLAISDGANQSGLSAWLGSELMGLQNLSHPLILFILLITLVSFTEVMSNAATVSLLTPILVALVSLKKVPIKIQKFYTGVTISVEAA